MKKRKLLLINPGNSYKGGHYKSSYFSNPPLNLATVAALTPEDWEIEIWDDNVRPFEYKEADLVGFTALTSQATRAYELAALYQERNIPTIMGGIHATMITEEAMQYMDVVVAGEAESIWKDVIFDFEQNNLKKLYQGEIISLDESPAPRTDLYRHNYGNGSIQTTRGCPHKCDFCSVWAINGHKHRCKPVDRVVEEYINTPQDRIYFVDDDFYGYSKESADRAKEICRKIIKSGVKKDWHTFTSMHLAQDEEALKLMSEAGCRLILLGVESEVTDQLMDAGKKTNLKIGVENYEEVFDTFQRNGISVLGSFVFGLEQDTPESIINRAEYYINSGIDCIQAGVLTPLPGTGVYHRLLKENRIEHNNFPKDWERYTFFNVTHRPKKMSMEEFEKLMFDVWEMMYDPKVIQKKYYTTLRKTRNPAAAAQALSANIIYRNIIFDGKKENLDFSEQFHKLSGLKAGAVYQW